MIVSFSVVNRVCLIGCFYLIVMFVGVMVGSSSSSSRGIERVVSRVVSRDVWMFGWSCFGGMEFLNGKIG